MEWLIDCDILEYCNFSYNERESQIKELPHLPTKPVYILPVFEILRAFHLLYKHYAITPDFFRKCWADFSNSYWGEWIHVSEYPQVDFPREITQVRKNIKISNDFPCEGTAERYWGSEGLLNERMRTLARLEPIVEDEIWRIVPPNAYDSPIKYYKSDSEDLVIDTNNFLELLNQLPENGLGVNVDEMRFPHRLSEKAVRNFKTIIKSYGSSNKLIVPLIVLEEAERVANYDQNLEKYEKVRCVIQAMALDPELPLWNTFFFEPLSQDILECFIQLYEGLYSFHTKKQHVLGLGDAIILAHGIYNRCPVASNEWFEKDDWQAVAEIFPYLELKDN